MRRKYTSSSNKTEWIAVPHCPCLTRSQRIKIHSVYYNCCKHGTQSFPETDSELDDQITDTEILEELEKEGHYDNPKDYHAIYPLPEVWEPFLDKLRVRPKNSQSKAWAMRYDRSKQLLACSTSDKIKFVREAAQREEDLLQTLQDTGILPQQFKGRVNKQNLEKILDTFKKSSGKTSRATRKKRKWPLLDDLGKRIVGKRHIPRAEISATKRAQEELRNKNTRPWVVSEGDKYLLTHAHDDSFHHISMMTEQQKLLDYSSSDYSEDCSTDSDESSHSSGESGTISEATSDQTHDRDADVESD